MNHVIIEISLSIIFRYCYRYMFICFRSWWIAQVMQRNCFFFFFPLMVEFDRETDTECFFRGGLFSDPENEA